MKNRIENLICVLLAFLVAGVVAYILYGKRVDEWRQVACSTLKNAVNTEIEERAQVADSLPMYTLSYYRPLAESDFPRVIDITTEQGKRQYTLTWEKFQRNVTQDPDMRVWHSMLFLKHPLSPDTLNRGWNDSLRSAGFSGKGARTGRRRERRKETGVWSVWINDLPPLDVGAGKRSRT